MAWRARLPRVKRVWVCTSSRLGWPSCADHMHWVGTGGARPSLGRGSRLLPVEPWQEGPGFGVQRPCALSCPVTLGRSPALRPHFHACSVKLTSGARAPQSRLCESTGAGGRDLASARVFPGLAASWEKSCTSWMTCRAVTTAARLTPQSGRRHGAIPVCSRVVWHRRRASRFRVIL